MALKRKNRKVTCSLHSLNQATVSHGKVNEHVCISAGSLSNVTRILASFCLYILTQGNQS